MSLPPVVVSDFDSMLGRLQEEMQALSGSTIYITGGAGFLGYYLCQLPLRWNETHAGEKPIRVVTSDNFRLRQPDWLKRLEHRSDFRCVTLDATRFVPDDEPLHYIFHCASIASPVFYRKFPVETIDANILGLRILLNYWMQRKVTRSMVYFSSSEIYGNPPAEQIPTAEEYLGNVSCTGPRACYDESKRLCESLCVSFHAQHGAPVKMVRPFNNYGPGLYLGDGRVLADFARQVVRGEDIQILSDGSPTRTFCYIADAVTGYYKVLVRGRDGVAYNVGTEEPEISVRDVAARMQAIGGELFGFSGKVIHGQSSDKNYLTDNPQRRCPNIARVRRECGFAPMVPLDDGLRSYLKWAAAELAGDA